jgi:cysteine-rich repeat protein
VVPAGNSIRAETFAPTDGTCTSADTIVRLWQANRTTQIVSDDDDGVGSCSLLNPATDVAVRGLAAGTYYVSVEDYQNDGTIAAYVLNVSIQPPACGDGFIGGSEVCDDGNTTPGDGCNATCQFEGSGELEPNNTTAAATTLINSGNTTGTLYGAIQSTGDVDVYRVQIQATSHLVAEVRGPDGSCPVDSTLRLLSSSGSQLATDTSDGPGECGRLSPGADSALRNLAAGTYYLEVAGTGSNDAYLLDARLMTPGCGDLYLTTGEDCDDGNSTAGDGCSATCQFELVELETNNTATTAQALGSNIHMVSGAIGSAGDNDYFIVTVPSGGSIAVFSNDGAMDQCTVDTVVGIYRPNGTLVIEDDQDGPSSCSAIYRFESGPLGAGAYRVRVRAFSASATFDYALSIFVQ